jgi:beclin 1
LDAWEAKLTALEAITWADTREIGKGVRIARERMLALRSTNVRLRDTLSRFRYLAVHNDAYFIWHRGPFVTINGCRLGRLPAQPVDWPEINAALGQTATLLTIIANRVNYKFQRYQIIPMGSFSSITPTSDDNTTHELYFTNRFWAQTRLNASLKALLVCISELVEFAQAADKSFWCPHPITHGGEKISDLPVGLGSKDAQWTRAMKCALTNVKWLLAWAFRAAE